MKERMVPSFRSATFRWVKITSQSGHASSNTISVIDSRTNTLRTDLGARGWRSAGEGSPPRCDPIGPWHGSQPISVAVTPGGRFAYISACRVSAGGWLALAGSLSCRRWSGGHTTTNLPNCNWDETESCDCRSNRTYPLFSRGN